MQQNVPFFPSGSETVDDDDVSNLTDDEFSDDDSDDESEVSEENDESRFQNLQFSNSYLLANFSVLKYVI